MIQQPLHELIEELRESGYYGSDPELPTIDRRRGTLITAVRQLEVCAAQMASPWLDDVVDEKELWSFAEANFFPRLASLAEIIETASHGEVAPAFLDAWSGVRRLIGKLSREAQDYGVFVVSLLVAAMVLRQLAETDAAPSGAKRNFVCESNNVAKSFLAGCFRKADLTPFDVNDNASLRELADRIRLELAATEQS